MAGMDTPGDDRSPKIGSISHRAADKASEVARKIVHDLSAAPPRGLHPALIPGVSVESTGRTYCTDALVFGVAITLMLGFIGGRVRW